MEQNDLYPSIEVKQQLEKYATLVPMTNAEFIVHFEEVHPGKKDCNCCPDERYGCGWYNAQYPYWTETKAIATVNAVYDIIKLYYPPEPQCSDGTGTCSTMADCDCSKRRNLLKGEAKQIGGGGNAQQYLRRLPPKTWPTPVCNLSSYHMLMAFHCTYKFLM